MKTFYIDDLLKSEMALKLGIDNIPPEGSFLLINRIAYTTVCFNYLQKFLNKPCIIDSGYRCKALNEVVGGKVDSQHISGEAVDFVCPEFGIPKEIVIFLAPKMHDLGIDLLILEQGWVHVSFTTNPRYKVLTCVRKNEYVFGIA